MVWLAEECNSKDLGSRLRKILFDYADLCLRAALDANIFENFRRDSLYTPVLEHVDAKTGHEYLKILINNGYGVDEIFEIIEPLQSLGNPILHDIGIGRPVSTTALRYLKIAMDIVRKFGTDLGRIVEVGCGFGGQAIILSRIASIQHYTFIDMWQVNLLIQRFIGESDFDIEYEIKTIRQASSNLDIDLAISNYAFSELDVQLQSICMRKFFLTSKHGYLTMNSGLINNMTPNSQVFSHITSNVLLSLIPSAKPSPETPLTSAANYVITW